MGIFRPLEMLSVFLSAMCNGVGYEHILKAMGLTILNSKAIDCITIED